MSRRTLAVILAAGLIAGVMAAPADAQRRKKKKQPKPVPVELEYFLRGTACDDATFQLSFDSGQDSSCNFTQSGIVYEARIQTGDADPRDLGQEFTAADGLPLILDTSKEITGEITTSNLHDVNQTVFVGAGQPTVVITVFGTAGGEEIEIGSHSETFITAPFQMHTSELEIEIDSDLEGVEFDDFSVQVLIRGASVGHGAVEMNDPESFIVVPTIQRRR